MHHKVLSSYKFLVGGLLVFFFGLTLGLTLGVTNSNNSFNAASEAATYGKLRNYYCTMTPAESNASILKTCNGIVGQQGFMGWEVVSDSHAYNGTGDGTSGTNTNKETTIKLGTSITLNKPEATLPNPVTWSKNTNCSAVQHDGDGAENGDVFVQYSVDANNYCVIYANDYQGKTLKLNRCKWSDQPSMVYWDNDNANDANLAKLRSQFATKCATPTPTTPPGLPTANMSTVCTAGQTFGNLKYDLKLSSISNPAQFNSVEYQMCMNPSSNYDHGYVYSNYFNGADYKGPNGANGKPTWACYKIGSLITYLNPNNNYMTVPWDSTKTMYGGKNLNSLANWIKDRAALGEMNSNTVFTTKAVLKVNNATNSNITSTYPTGLGGIRINPTACVNPTPTTPPVASCTYTTVVHTPTSEEYVWSGGVVKKVSDYSLPKIDKSKAIKIAADWGWAGVITTTQATNQQGPVQLPGTINDKAAGGQWQKNETSKVYLNYYNSSNVPTLLGNSTINCIDAGEWKASGDSNTPFSDGRIVTYNGVTTNLKNPITGGGKWYTCPSAVTTKPVESTAATKVWKTAAMMPANAKDKVQIVREYTGGNIGTSNNSLKGSNYSRVSIQYCKLP